MKTRIPLVATALAVAFLGAAAPLHAADNAQMEAVLKRMRDTLRNTMVQLQTAESEKQALQTQLTESDQKNKDLSAQAETLNKKIAEQSKQMLADKSDHDKKLTELNATVANRDQEIARLNEALAKWKEGYNKVAGIARSKEAERAQLASKVVVLDRKVSERERQNLELYKTGKEILTRYENFGLGNALLAREPFVGTARVKMQNQVQDYQDKLMDQKVKPADSMARSAAPAPAEKQAAHSKSRTSPPPPPMEKPTTASQAPLGKGSDQKSKS
jgi:chromosome segregation ATPase